MRRYYSSSSDDAFTIILYCVAIIVLVIASLIVSRLTCLARWYDSYPVRYGPIMGCQIQVDEKWLPEDRYYQQP